MSYKIAALYRFVCVSDLPSLRSELLTLCQNNEICGTLLIAHEGINGTIAGPAEGLDRVVDALDQLLGIRQGEVKFSYAGRRPFRRLKVRIKAELITLRAPQANPAVLVGQYVTPEDWNAVISDPETVVLDTRNRYETRLGTFERAIDPDIDTFTEFKQYVAENLDPAKHRKVAMFCTGGIRCEKASAYMLSEGFEEVFHLKGGILQYLEDVPQQETLWQGECYVFDERVAVGHGLVESTMRNCFGCGEALSKSDMSRPEYESGVSCHHCIGELTEERAKGLRQRNESHRVA
ncbi:rhodanese-related sulfurtransferase [Aureimonas fodinaquatilis]|uniref:tRNA uridine(34) hydroxylase n=1 Tax=Aureimonas fodinaquatilis TaxID=2565783 RepID=A0A5B0E0C1_9HYPH|nr:rhodanese-related sulfurtransferase [Aureimonas fodinaquatilis]KAA0972507.1 rhodanese-related sulfurtransferase [Aureimonas fodinaquatilis]